MAEVCERIIWSGDGAEARWGEVIVKERRATGHIFGDPARRTGNQPHGPLQNENMFVHCECKYVRTLASERAYILYLNFGTTSA